MCKGLENFPASCLKSAKDVKHWIGTLLQKPDLQLDPSAVSKKKKTSKSAKAKRTDRAEVRQWGESLGNLVNSKAGLTAFTAFLESEFSQENIEFWVACEDYQKTTCKKQLTTKAWEIYNEYINVKSPKEVNLDSSTREEVRRNMAEVRASCFEEAQRKIFLLMEKDSYQRFLRSRLFLDLLQDSGTCGCRGAEGESGKVLSDRAGTTPWTP